MYLKNLQLVGFKSFAEKTNLEFLPGVTAIVGPNGCGKSNVADAVRWVLGEQSAKALRGDEMADVIFSGTDNRKPIGMAEVSLTIGNVSSEQLRAAGVALEYNEVTVSRRVFRDGHGEYFINKTPVRLKDIQQLFMDTGVGRTSYSLMAQGQIDQILSAHPEDRRAIFEEAAGITRFKSQKKEALRKLEHTEANLVRLADIIREVKRQIGSLQRQAGKAKRYRELHEQLKILETKLARHQYDDLIEQLKSNQTRADVFAAELGQVTRNTESGETRLAATRHGLEELEQQTNDEARKRMELQTSSERHANRIQFNNERLSELATQSRKAEVDIAGTEEKATIQEKHLAQIAGQCLEIEALLAQEESRVSQSLEAQNQADQQIELQEQQADLLKNQAIELESNTAHLRNELSALDTTQRNTTLRLERLSAEKNSLAEQRSQYAQKLEGFRADIAQQRTLIETERTALQRQRQVLEQLTGELHKINGEILEQTAQLEGEMSKLRLWQQLEKEHQGLSEGGKALLQRGADFGVLGSLSKILHVPSEFTVAIETALGQALHAILVRDANSAAEITGILRSQHLGRAAILAANWMKASPARLASPSWAIGWAVDKVECSEEYRPLLERLLGRVLLVSDIRCALTESNGDYDLVTVDGEWVGSSGLILGGVSTTGPLSRSAEIAECRKLVEELRARVDASKKRNGELDDRRQRVEHELSQQSAALHGREVALASKEGEWTIIQSENQEVLLKVETVDFELNSLSSQDPAGRRQQILSQIAEHGQTQEGLHAQLSQAEQGLAQLEDARRQLSDALTEAKVALATQQQRHANLLGQKEPAEARLAELRETIATRRAECAANDERSNQLRHEISESEMALEQLAAERIEVERVLGERAQQRQELNASLSEQEEQIRALHKQRSEVQQRKSDLDVQIAELRMNINHLKERIQQKYQVNLEEVKGEGFVITIADSGKPEIHEVTANEAQEAGVNVTPWDEVQQQVVELQSRLDAMGPVNLGAVEEFEELEQRHKFLTEQQEDLVKAKDQLLEVLAKINATTKQLFTENFEKIRANFQEMFTELFGGGKANLLLVDEGDVLESGIEIVARPPGKQLQSISLLSGGERTMTAVALLFSIYMVKPSPFCVLDELDAPLDESNINRFIQILTRFRQQSQFIIITHNKRTIAMGDVLYGVTMEEHGISKIVSVKFRKQSEVAPVKSEPQVRALAGESPIANDTTDEVATNDQVPTTHIEEPPSPEEMARLQEAQVPWKHAADTAAPNDAQPAASPPGAETGNASDNQPAGNQE
jgi:chromosome segregation protein